MKVAQKAAAGLLIAVLLVAIVAKIWWRLRQAKPSDSKPAGSTLAQRGRSLVKRLLLNEQHQAPPSPQPDRTLDGRGLAATEVWQRNGLQRRTQPGALPMQIATLGRHLGAQQPRHRTVAPAFGTETIFIAMVARHGQEALAALTAGHLFAACARPMRLSVGIVLVVAAGDGEDGTQGSGEAALIDGAGRGWLRRSSAWESAIETAKRLLFPPALGHMLDHNVRLFPLRAEAFRGHASAMRLAFDHLYRGESYAGTLRVGRLPSHSWDVAGLAELAALHATGVDIPALTTRCAVGPAAAAAAAAVVETAAIETAAPAGATAGWGGLASRLTRLGGSRRVTADTGPSAPSAFVCFERWTPFGTPHMRTRACAGRPRRPHPTLAWSSDWSLGPARVWVVAAPWDPWLEHLGPRIVDWTMTVRMWLAGVDLFAPSGAIALGRLPALSWSARLRVGRLALASETQDRNDDDDDRSSSIGKSYGALSLRGMVGAGDQQHPVGPPAHATPASGGNAANRDGDGATILREELGAGYFERDEHALAYGGSERGDDARAANNMDELRSAHSTAESVRRRAMQLHRDAALRRLAVVLGSVAASPQSGVVVEPLYRIRDRAGSVALGRTVAGFVARCGMDWRAGTARQAAFAGMVPRDAPPQTMGVAAAAAAAAEADVVPFDSDDVVSKYGSWNEFYDATGYVPEVAAAPAPQ